MSREMPNILLITIDSMRFDHLGCYGYRRDTSPNIDRLASKGTLFMQAISNGGSTPSAFPSILASALPPLDENEWQTIMPRHITLAELLHRAGYRTAAFHCNPYLSKFFSYNKGFDVFEDNLGGVNVWTIRDRIARGILPSSVSRPLLNFLTKLYKRSPFLSFALRTRAIIRAQQINKQAISWLKSHNDSFFLWLHYMDVHTPYMPPQKYVSRFHEHWLSRYQMYSLSQKMLTMPAQLSPSEIEKLKDLYDAAIRYVDNAIGMLLDALRDNSHNTIVVITSDHGEEFGETGKFSHLTSLYERILHVPLVITGPGIKPRTLVKEQVSLLDLAPTISSLVGIDDVHAFQGENLLPVIEGKTKVTRGTISTLTCQGQRYSAYRIPEWKYICSESLDASETLLAEELYGLRNDPMETRNLHDANIEEAKRFELEAIDKLMQFKKLKIEDETNYEKQRIRVKLNKLRKL